MFIDALVWFLGVLGVLNAVQHAPITYQTTWSFAVIQGEGATKTGRLYNGALDSGLDVQMPTGHHWECERLPLTNDGSGAEQGTFVCAQDDAMFTVTAVCQTDSPDSDIAASALLQANQPKMLFAIMCKTEKKPKP